MNQHIQDRINQIIFLVADGKIPPKTASYEINRLFGLYDNNDIRPSVMWFAKEMENKLKQNNHKGGWGVLTKEMLFERLQDEVEELKEAIEESSENAIYESCDVANFSMMIADISQKGMLKFGI